MTTTVLEGMGIFLK